MIENNVDTAFFHSWFRNYVKSFYTEDPKIQQNIRLKEEQFKTYGTFDDRVSENHATLGLKVLKVTNILGRLTKTEQ